MADPAAENILKVLSGNQFGAEVALTDGTYTFGSGQDADIYLLDVSLQPRHGQVRLRDGKIEVRALQGDLGTASGLVVTKDDETWHEIAQMDAVTAGLSKFVIAGAGANWQGLAAPMPQPAPHRFDFAPLDRLFATVPRRALYGAGAVAAVLLLVALFSGGGRDAAQGTGADGQGAAVAALRQTLTDMPFARRIGLTERADGTLAIEGYVEDQVERRAIQNSLDASGLPGTLRVYVLENLRADVAGTIDSMKIPAQFRIDDSGNLTLTGTVLDPLAAEKLVENLQTGVFGLASVKSELRTADQILSDLRGIAADAGLGDLVIFRLDGLVVEATGIVPRDKMDNWVGLIGVYSRRFASEIPLRSFVTLDQPAATGTAPVIIGTGPLAQAETGRVVAPETLAEPNEVDAQSLFAGEPLSAPSANGATAPAALAPNTAPDAAPAAAAALPPVPGNLAAALTRLRVERPDLYATLQRSVDAGRTPDPDLLQQIMTALGGRMQTSTSPDTGRTTVEVVIPGIGSLGTLSSLAADLDAALAGANQTAAAPAAPVASAPVAASPLVQAALAPLLAPFAALAETPAQQDSANPAAAQPPATAAAPAGATPAAASSDAPQTAPAPQAATASTATAAATPGATPTAAATPGAPAPASPDAPAPAPSAPPVPAAVGQTDVAAAQQPAPSATSAPAASPQTALPPAGQTQTGLPFFALPRTEAQGMARLMAEADDAVNRNLAQAAAGQPSISANLRALVAMQHEQLTMGRTLMRLPRPMTALPYPVDEPVACWPGGRLTPEMLPTTLLLLDSLSVSSDTDLTGIAPDLRDGVMEAALSPDRVRACLAKTRTDYGRMVGESSAFLAETARNPDFVEFLFRKVPRAELAIAGASLQDDRYIELADGRKLREGAAPDITSRILAIGDLGVLVRTADGTMIRLFGLSLGWRVVDACPTGDCGVK